MKHNKSNQIHFQFTDSDYPFGICKLFLNRSIVGTFRKSIFKFCITLCVFLSFLKTIFGKNECIFRLHHTPKYVGNIARITYIQHAQSIETSSFENGNYINGLNKSELL